VKVQLLHFEMEVTDRARIPEIYDRAGFDFSLVNRNQVLATSGSGSSPKFWKTGTTICGCIIKDAVVLGADTRATGGSEVVDKNCEKIHYLAPNIWCCGAGTAADTEKTTELIASNLELLRMSTGSNSRVVTALTMLKRMLYKYQGQVSAALVLGGVDVHGPHLYNIYPHGSSDMLPYVTMGSGSLAAMSVFESSYKEDMSEEEGIALVKDAIRSGIFNDLGSGSRVDITVIRKDGISRFRSYENSAGDATDYKSQYRRPSKLTPPPGTTLVIEESFRPHKNNYLSAVETSAERMEIS
jgi:20S proteasome subunit beta 2